jgi:hypothetical protein
MMAAYYSNSGGNLIIPTESQIQSGEIPDDFINNTFSEYSRLWLSMTDNQIDSFKRDNKDVWNLFKNEIKSALKNAKASRVL